MRVIEIEAPRLLSQKLRGMGVKELERIVNEPQDLEEALVAVEFDELVAALMAEIAKSYRRRRDRAGLGAQLELDLFPGP